MHSTDRAHPFVHRLLFALLAGLAWVAPLASQSISFDDEAWSFRGDAEMTRHLGTSALRLDSGVALRRDLELQDGTIDVDVSMPDGRSFVYVMFRMAADRDHEEIYLRPHKANLPDALQYSAVFRGNSGWQLYHGDGGTAVVDLPQGEWVHVRVVVQGEKAAVFVGDTKTPALVVPRLARGTSGGFVGLRSFLPRGTDATHGAHFANLEVRPGKVDFDFSAVTETPPAPGTIETWEISDAVAAPEDPEPTLPEIGAWRAVETAPSGILNFDRFVERPERRALVHARLVLEAEEDVLQPIELGASDVATVFLDGRPLFRIDASYSFDRPRRQGVLNLDRTVYLPLEKGRNELVLAISDGFGGWGLLGRLDPASGVRVARP